MDGQLSPDVLDKLSQDYFKAIFRPVNTVYIDLETMQDFRLGALMQLITTKVEFEYIHAKMEDYNGRFDDKTMTYFPALKDITDEAIDAFIADTTNHRVLSRLSPMALFYDLVPELLAQLNMINQRCEGNNKDVSITIGTGSVIYDQLAKRNLISTFLRFDPTLTVEVLNRPLPKMEEELIGTFDMYAIYDIKSMLYDPRMMKVVGEELGLIDAKVLGYPLLEEELQENETAEDLLVNTKTMLNVYCNFEYLERGVQEPD